MDKTLNNLQRLICHKTQTLKQKFKIMTENKVSFDFSKTYLL